MKNIKQLPFLLLTGILAIAGISCQKIADNSTATSTNISEMKVSPDFKFRTAKEIGIKVYTLDNTGAPVPNMRIDVYSDIPENNGSVLLSGITDSQGLFSSPYKFAEGTDSLAVGTTAIGFCTMQKVKVVNGELNLTLGGKDNTQGFKSGSGSFFKSTISNFYPMGTYNANGVPNYLTLPNDVIDASMLQDINATLPDYVNAVNRRPQYFSTSNEHNLLLNEACNVWVTFVSEGAGYRNILGYYTYNKNNPPSSPSAIDSIHVIFPNVSFNGSGGGLSSGNKVHLGTYPPGTEIGWVLVADGFRGNTITGGNWTLYSDINLNPEPDAAKKQHTVLLNDIGRGKFLLSFEDIRRDAGSDNDFNDAVFYVTADPIQAIATQNMPLPDYSQSDSDHDGISDAFDSYPNDPSKSFNNYYPSKENFGSLAFEDLWPSQGDYDFNDMVVDYNFNQITNGQNKVVQIVLRAKLSAMGGYFQNGLGIQLPVAPNLIASVTGTNIKESYIVQNSNGTEAGQSKATIIVFDNGFNLLPFPGGTAVGVNTTPGAVYVAPKELTVTINLSTPVAISTMGLPPYNPFMIKDGKRGYEVHLIDNPPTDLADASILGSSDDDSNPAAGRYYVTKNNLPFALDVSSHFDYPVEKTKITEAYLKFVPWGESSGVQYFDWFKTGTGYRSAQNIFTK